MAAVAAVVGPSRVNSPTTRSGPAASWCVLLAITALAAIGFMLVAANRVLSGRASARAAGAVLPAIAWGRCTPPGRRLQCARVSVPLDWVHPNGGTIQL